MTLALGPFEFRTWEGALQTPASRGGRLSNVRTSALAEDLSTAWTTAYGYSGLVSPNVGWQAVIPGDLAVSGVAVAGVTVESVKRVRGPALNGYLILATWSLLWN